MESITSLFTMSNIGHSTRPYILKSKQWHQKGTYRYVGFLTSALINTDIIFSRHELNLARILDIRRTLSISTLLLDHWHKAFGTSIKRIVGVSTRVRELRPTMVRVIFADAIQGRACRSSSGCSTSRALLAFNLLRGSGTHTCAGVDNGRIVTAVCGERTTTGVAGHGTSAWVECTGVRSNLDLAGSRAVLSDYWHASEIAAGE